MTVTDQIKILDDKIKSNQAQYDLVREAANISALSSKDLLEKYEYLTDEDLGHKLSVFEKTKFEYCPFGMILNEAFKKEKVNDVAKSKSDFNYDSNHTFFEFYKRIDEFNDTLLGSKYNIMKNVNKRLIKLKNIKSMKSETRLKKEGIIKMLKKFTASIMKSTKTSMTTVVNLIELKIKILTTKFMIVNKTDKESKLDEETKKIFKEIEKREKDIDKKGFMKYFNYEPTALVNKLLSQNIQDF